MSTAQIIGLVLLVAGTALTLIGGADQKATEKRRLEWFDDWKKQGEIVVFQAEAETFNDAQRRLKCHKGIIVISGEDRQVLVGECTDRTTP